jgi:glutamate synthase (NADPH/NADH) large chain
VLRALVQRHARETDSKRAKELLRTWDEARAKFVQICPSEMLSWLTHKLSDKTVAIAGE